MIFEQDASYWTEDAKIEFAVDVERKMQQLGLQRKDLAERIESSPAYVTKLLRGDANLTIESMAKVAYALGGRLSIHIAHVGSRTKWLDVIENPRRNQLSDAWVAAEKQTEHPHYASAIFA